jgi:hypothetical protein
LRKIHLVPCARSFNGDYRVRAFLDLVKTSSTAWGDCQATPAVLEVESADGLTETVN